MHGHQPQPVVDSAGPPILTTLGVTGNPVFFHFETFPQLVATIASIVGIVWGVINIGKFAHHFYQMRKEKRLSKKLK